MLKNTAWFDNAWSCPTDPMKGPCNFWLQRLKILSILSLEMAFPINNQVHELTMFKRTLPPDLWIFLFLKGIINFEPLEGFVTGFSNYRISQVNDLLLRKSLTYFYELSSKKKWNLMTMNNNRSICIYSGERCRWDFLVFQRTSNKISRQMIILIRSSNAKNLKAPDILG